MDLATILPTALALSTDCFAVALAAGIPGGEGRLREAGRIALAFGSFQTGMPFLGWIAGRSVISFISGFDHWIAFFLLVLVGTRMIREGFSGEEEAVTLATGPILLLAVATSIDALAVGVSFAFLDIGILVPCLVIGLSTFAVSLAGGLLGGAAAERWGRATEVLGGLVLIGIGIPILIEHMAG
jgi:putative Mn2+ efflux pump MntP